MRWYRIGVVVGLMAVASMACSIVDDVSDTVDSVNEVVDSVDQAVSLLEDIENNGSWETISTGLDALVNQDQGYLADMRFEESRSGSVTRSAAFAMQVDGQNDILAVLNGGTQFFVDGNPAAAAQSNVYRIDNGRYTCVNDSEEARLIRSGVNGVFTEYSLIATGVQLLSVVDEVGDDTVAGRDVTHYTLESKIDEALEILKKFNNPDLQAKIAQAGSFELTGDLYVDKSTEAILRFNSTYAQTDQSHRIDLSFNVTQWGGVADIAEPTPDQIALPCAG